MRVQLTLKNWRSVEDAVIDGSPLTVLVGRNASGKSNVVDALAFLAEARRDLEGAVRRRGGIESIRRWSPTKPHDVTVGVRVERDCGTFSHSLTLRSGRQGGWSVHHEQVFIEEAGREAFRVERGDRRFTVSGPAPLRSDGLRSGTPRPSLSIWPLVDVLHMGGADPLTDLDVLVLRPAPTALRQPQVPDDGAELLPDASNLASVVRKLDAPKLGRVVERLRQVVPGLLAVRALEVGRHLTLHFTQQQGSGRRPEFLGSEMSDGALAALAILVAAERMQPRDLLVIEEPEAHVHPGAAGVIYDALERASERGAVWITTHSPELLERAPAATIRVCEYDDGITRVGPLSVGQRDVLRSGLYTAGELMRADELRREGGPAHLVADG